MISALLITAVCHVGGAAPFVKPDNACTPGAFDRLPRYCVHRARPQLPTAERQWILGAYGVLGWTGRDGEIDHRVPFFLGGTTDRRNLWPEVGSIPNAKDRLEFYVYRRVCVSHTMRVRTARFIFFGDWVASFRKYCLT